MLWPLRLKTHFLLCTSLYLLNQKTYFAIVSRFLYGVWGYANQLFRLNFDHFTGFWKIEFSKNIKSKFLGCRFFRNFSYIFFWKLKCIITWSIFKWKISFTYRWNPLEKLQTFPKTVYVFNKNKYIQRRKRVFDKTGHNTLRGPLLIPNFLYFLLMICLNL